MTIECAGLPTAVVRSWRVSDSRTRVTFTVRGMGGLVHGSVACNWGELDVDPAGAPVRVRAELDLNSLVTGIAKRDADLRKPRFLDTDRHPTMTWSADRFRSGAAGEWVADGELRVRGTSAPLTVAGTPEADGAAVRVRAQAVLDRAAVGIRAPRLLIGRTVRISVEAWLVPAR